MGGHGDFSEVEAAYGVEVVGMLWEVGFSEPGTELYLCHLILLRNCLPCGILTGSIWMIKWRFPIQYFRVFLS
jgi:hypothetical protein